MASIKFMLEVDRDSGELLNVLDQNGSPAVVNTEERRQWKMNDIHISAGKKGSASTPSSRMACGAGTCSLVINNREYCLKC